MLNFKDYLKANSQRPVAYFPIYAKLTGSVSAGVLLGQMLHWWSSMDGEFYKTEEDFCEELSIGEYELKAAKAKLISLNIVTIDRRDMRRKTYYNINTEILQELISELLISRSGKNPPRDSGKTPLGTVEKPTSLHINKEYTKNTVHIDLKNAENPVCLPSGGAISEEASLNELIASVTSSAPPTNGVVTKKVKLVKPKKGPKILETVTAVENSQISLLLDFFINQIGNSSIKYSNIWEREACVEMIRKYGYEQTLNAANYAKSIRGHEFAPSIITPVELRAKYLKLGEYKAKYAPMEQRIEAGLASQKDIVNQRLIDSVLKSIKK